MDDIMVTIPLLWEPRRRRFSSSPQRVQRGHVTEIVPLIFVLTNLGAAG